MKTTPSSKRTTIGLGPASKSMALTVCGSTPLGIFARISGNHSRRLRGFSVSRKSLRMALWPCVGFQVERAPRRYSKLPSAQGSPRRVTIPGLQNVSALETAMKSNWGLFKDTGLLGDFLENQDVPHRANLSFDPQSLSSCRSCFPLYSSFLTNHSSVTRCHSSS